MVYTNLKYHDVDGIDIVKVVPLILIVKFETCFFLTFYMTMAALICNTPVTTDSVLYIP